MDPQKPPSRFKVWLKRVGWAGFFFFLIKGLIWIVVFLFFKDQIKKAKKSSDGQHQVTTK